MTRSGPGSAPAGPPAPASAARRSATALLGDRAEGLGRVATLAVWLAGVTGSAPPPQLRRVRLVLIASPDDDDDADGLPADDVVLGALARTTGATVRVLDVVTGEPASPGAHGVAELTDDEFEAAYELGRYVADEEADAGTDLLLVGVDPASVATDAVSGTAVLAALLGREPVAVMGTDTGRGSTTGLDDRTWMTRAAAARDLLRRVRRAVPGSASGAGGAAAVLRLVGGPRITALAGLLAQSASRRTPVVLDGAGACAAALAAARLSPGAERWWQAAAVTPEPGAAAALGELGLAPLLDLRVRGGDGRGALLAVPVLEAAGEVLAALAPPPEDP